jgi:hypothetical protein
MIQSHLSESFKCKKWVSSFWSQDGSEYGKEEVGLYVHRGMKQVRLIGGNTNLSDKERIMGWIGTWKRQKKGEEKE